MENVTIIRVNGHYEIRLYDEVLACVDSWAEVREELAQLGQEVPV